MNPTNELREVQRERAYRPENTFDLLDKPDLETHLTDDLRWQSNRTSADVAIEVAVPRTSKKRIRLLNIITVLGTGGATNVVLDIAEHFQQHPDFESDVLSGPIIPGRTDMTPKAHQRGIRTHVVPSLVNHISPIVNAKSIAEIRRFITQGQYDIVHTHTSVAGIVGRIAARAAKVPAIVHHVHGWGWNQEMSKPVRSLEIFLERLCARFTDKLVTVSRPDLEKGHAFQIAPTDKLDLIYNGIDLERFRQPSDTARLRREIGLRPESKVVGMIGRLDRQKNPLDFIRAASIVSQHYQDVQFVIVGDGPLQIECEELIRELGLENRLFLLGYRDDVPELLAMLTMTAMSSLWEGLPLVFVESMSAGRPIVANDIDGACEVVSDGETGYLVTPHQPSEMAERILLLLRDSQRCESMGNTARQRSNKYSHQATLEQIESMYRELHVAAEH